MAKTNNFYSMKAFLFAFKTLFPVFKTLFPRSGDLTELTNASIARPWDPSPNLFLILFASV
jgi:hypothetical protein